MILYDGFIKDIEALVHGCDSVFPYSEPVLKDAPKSNIMLLKDTAFELGGSSQPNVSTLAVSSDMHFDNCTYLIGQDLYTIKKDCAFGKIVLLEIADVSEDEAFEKIKELELVRYKYCPEGFMTRASALSMREQIRVGKKTVNKKISLKEYGNFLIKKYLSFPLVKSVKIVFITGDFDYTSLSVISEKIKSTTGALNHIFDNILFDCNSCNLKEICDEVEGMKELHRKTVQK